MAKKQKVVKAPRPETLWEYQCILPQENGRPDTVIWVREDDERSASYKAISKRGTGKIRSKLINTGENNEWAVKAQNLLPQREGGVIEVPEELSYEQLANLALKELVERDPIAAEGDDKAVLDQGRYEPIGPQVWVITWEGGPDTWAFDYKTNVPGVYASSWNEKAVMIHPKDALGMELIWD